MSIKKISANRASYQSHITGQSATEPDAIQRVTAVTNNVVDTATLVDDDKHRARALHLKKVAGALERQQRRCRRIIARSTNESTQQIIDFVLSYNQVIYLIVQAEQAQDRQIDQAIQHFLMAHGKTLRTIGLETRQSIYLEYNKIKLKDYVSQFNRRQIQLVLFAKDSLFDELLNRVDQLISKLHDKPDINTEQSFHLDIKA